QSLLGLIQEREALAALQQAPGLGPRRPAQVGQRRRDDRLGLAAIVEPAFGREELERGLGPIPGRLGRQGLIPGPFRLTPEPVRRRRTTLARQSLTATLVQRLLGRVGTLQGTGSRAPGRPQGTPPFAERVEDVERVVESGQTRGATAGLLQLQ